MSDLRERNRILVDRRRIGGIVRDRRKAAGMSQYALAREIRVARTYVTRIELGTHEPRLSTLEAICNALGMSVSELFR